MNLLESSKRAGCILAPEVKEEDSEELHFRRGSHGMIDLCCSFFHIYMYIYSGNRSRVTLHFTNITVQDDQGKGLYQCIGYPAKGDSDSQRFTVRVTASKSETLSEQSVKGAILHEISTRVSESGSQSFGQLVS